MNKLMIVLVLAVGGLGAQNAMVYKAQLETQEEMLETQGQMNGHMEDYYTLMKSDSSRLYTIMDTLVRIFHYAKPHEKSSWSCPECAEIYDRSKSVDTITISRDQYKKLLEYEKSQKQQGK